MHLIDLRDGLRVYFLDICEGEIRALKNQVLLRRSSRHLQTHDIPEGLGLAPLWNLGQEEAAISDLLCMEGYRGEWLLVLRLGPVKLDEASRHDCGKRLGFGEDPFGGECLHSLEVLDELMFVD